MYALKNVWYKSGISNWFSLHRLMQWEMRWHYWCIRWRKMTPAGRIGSDAVSWNSQLHSRRIIIPDSFKTSWPLHQWVYGVMNWYHVFSVQSTYESVMTVAKINCFKRERYISNFIGATYFMSENLQGGSSFCCCYDYCNGGWLQKLCGTLHLVRNWMFNVRCRLNRMRYPQMWPWESLTASIVYVSVCGIDVSQSPAENLNI